MLRHENLGPDSTKEAAIMYNRRNGYGGNGYGDKGYGKNGYGRNGYGRSGECGREKPYDSGRRRLRAGKSRWGRALTGTAVLAVSAWLFLMGTAVARAFEEPVNQKNTAAEADTDTDTENSRERAGSNTDSVIRIYTESYETKETNLAGTTGASEAAGSLHAAQDSEDAYPISRKIPEVPVIVIDPGHGGDDEGCFAGSILEKNINLQIADQLRSQLTELGYQVVMTREADTYVTKEQRVELANQSQADALISIHQNTYEDHEPAGIETWFDGTDTARDSGGLADLIHRETVKSTGAAARELRADAGFMVTTKADMASCLIETGFLSNPEECARLASAEYQEKLAAGIAKGIDLYFHPKTMYLTFDDGPSAENTSAVLDILKARNIKATFFVVGENVRKNPEVARRIAAEGHTIGIHCYRHDYEKIYQSVESYTQDFEEAYQAVLEVTGVRAKLFRFPGGSINAYNKAVSSEIIKEMTSRGFIYYDWNASLDDALKKSEPEELIANASNTTLGRKKVVMLAHDIVHSTALCLDDLIDQFPEYQMEPLTPEVTPVQFQ